jgi:hypothetical protein
LIFFLGKNALVFIINSSQIEYGFSAFFYWSFGGHGIFDCESLSLDRSLHSYDAAGADE